MVAGVFLGAGNAACHGDGELAMLSVAIVAINYK
jgi:hypothetical protein